MAHSPKRPDDAAWDDLEQAFFASAPPDVPELPPPAESFDDLFPGAPPTKERATRIGVRDTLRDTFKSGWVRASARIRTRVRPALGAAGRQSARLTAAAWRRSSRALGSAGQATVRTARALAPALGRLIDALPVRRLNGQVVAIAVASMILVTGASAVVVASRNGARASLPATPLGSRASAAGTTVASAMPEPALPFAAESEPPQPQALGPDPEPETTPAQEPAREPRHQRADAAAKRTPAPPPAHKHHKPASYSADRDLMVPTFMSPAARLDPAPPPAAPTHAATPAHPAAPAPRIAPAPANAPAPAHAARPFFAR